MSRFVGSGLCALILGVLVGCGAPEPEPALNEPAAQAEGGHVHDPNAVGPHGGHILHFEPSGVHGEWTHDDDTHEVAVYLDDMAAEDIQTVKFVATIGEETEEYALEKGADGWTVTSEALMTNIDMDEAVQVMLVVTTTEGDQTCEIEAHEHHHH